MAANQVPIYPNVLRNFTIVFSNNNLQPAFTQNTVNLYYGNNNGARIDSMSIVNNDTLNHNVAFYVAKSGGANTLVGVVYAVAGAGNSSATPPAAVLSNINMALAISDPYGNKVMYVEAGSTLSFSCLDQISNQKSIIITGMAGEF